jgi:hypothetical protein
MSKEKSKEEKVWKLILITAAVIVPLLLGWLVYELVNLNDNVDKIEAVNDPQYENFDSLVWMPEKVKYKTIEKYETYTRYILSFYDDTEANVTIGDFNDLKIDDSTCMGVTQTFRRLKK